MGTEHSRHKRRHTLAVNPTSPYINQSDIISKLDHPQPNIRASHANGTKAYSVDFGAPNKMKRSVSTPAFSAHAHAYPQTRETLDHQPTTPNQHLITTLPRFMEPNTEQIVKKKPIKLKHRHTLFDSFKSKPKLKSHHRLHSAVPYVHFPDDKHAKNGKHKRKKPSILRHAFGSDICDSVELDMSNDMSYHSDPGYTQKISRKFNKTKPKPMRRATTISRFEHNAQDTDDTDNKNKRKILLLGNGSCGKSTIFKQLKLILGTRKAFDDNELAEATHAIRQNCVSVLLIILHKSTVLYSSGMQYNNKYLKECHIDDSNEAIRDSIHYVMKYRSESFEKTEEDFTELSKNIAFLWSLACVQTAVQLRHKRFTIPDNMWYFYDQIECVFAADYVPSIEDIIRLRIRTTGMIESKYTMTDDKDIRHKYELSLFDTGGERNERKKWIHTFENVDVVIYVAALSHFCCVLWEDEKTISMHDAIELFGEICNGRWFRRSEMILFLNKNDIFRQMLYDEISLNVGFARDITQEDYDIKTNNAAITPPPSPKCNLNGNMMHVKEMKDESIEADDVQMDNKINLEEEYHLEYVPFQNLNQWSGQKWNGPNFKYDRNKSAEENDIYFEKCYDKAIEFIASVFLKQNRDHNKTVYVHITSAIDERNIKQVFEEIQPLIINSNYAGHAKHFF